MGGWHEHELRSDPGGIGYREFFFLVESGVNSLKLDFRKAYFVYVWGFISSSIRAVLLQFPLRQQLICFERCREPSLTTSMLPLSQTQLNPPTHPPRLTSHWRDIATCFVLIQLEKPGFGVRASRGGSYRREKLPWGGVRADQLCVPEKYADGRSAKNGESCHHGVPREGRGGGGGGGGGDLLENRVDRREPLCGNIVRIRCGTAVVPRLSYLFLLFF